MYLDHWGGHLRLTDFWGLKCTIIIHIAERSSVSCHVKTYLRIRVWQNKTISSKTRPTLNKRRISPDIKSALARDQLRKLCVCPRVHVRHFQPIRFCSLNAAKSMTACPMSLRKESPQWSALYFLTVKTTLSCPLRKEHAFLLKLISFGQGFSFLYNYCCIWLFIYLINIFNKKSCFIAS